MQLNACKKKYVKIKIKQNLTSSKARISLTWKNKNDIYKLIKKCLTVHLVDGVQKSHCNYKMCNFSSLIYFGKVQFDSLRDVKPINNISDYVRTYSKWRLDNIRHTVG